MKKTDFIATDGYLLNGFIYQCEEATKDVILSVHGMTSNCLKKRNDITARVANKNNIDYFCFNNRGSDLAKYIKRKIENK